MFALLALSLLTRMTMADAVSAIALHEPANVRAIVTDQAYRLFATIGLAPEHQVAKTALLNTLGRLNRIAQDHCSENPTKCREHLHPIVAGGIADAAERAWGHAAPPSYAHEMALRILERSVSRIDLLQEHEALDLRFREKMRRGFGDAIGGLSRAARARREQNWVVAPVRLCVQALLKAS